MLYQTKKIRMFFFFLKHSNIATLTSVYSCRVEKAAVPLECRTRDGPAQSIPLYEYCDVYIILKNRRTHTDAFVVSDNFVL